MSGRRPWQGPVDVETVPPTFRERLEAAAILTAVFGASLAMLGGGAWIVLALVGALWDAVTACIC